MSSLKTFSSIDVQNYSINIGMIYLESICSCFGILSHCAPLIYYSEKMSLYLEMLTDRTAFNLANFKEEMYLGLRSKWLRGQIIKSRVATDQEILANLVSATVAG